jgi:hypothetical protein
MSAQEIHTRTSVVHLDEQNIVRVTILPGVEETLADAQATATAANNLADQRRLPLVVDMREMKSQTRDARQYYGSPAVMRATTAVALLVESRVSMVVANFFITVTKTSVPTKIFTNEADALAWVKEYIQ